MVKKKQIIEATLKLMEETTFENLRVDDIAQKAGVSKRTLYKYFPSKKVLISVIIAEKHDLIQQKIIDILNNDGNEVDKYDQLFTFVTSEIASQNINLFDHLKKYPDLYEEIKIRQQQMMNNLEQIIENGIKKEEIKPEYNSRIVAFLLIKMANIIFDPDFLMNHKVTFEEITENLKRLVLNGLKKEKER